MKLEIVILAAGDGKRMKSALPKVVHSIGGKPMLMRVIETAMQLQPKKIHVVCGIHTEVIQNKLKDYLQDSLVKNNLMPDLIHWVYQEKPLGTGHAVQCALPFIDAKSQVLVLFGDVPLINIKTLEALCEKAKIINSALSILSVNRPDSFGFGRVIREPSGKIQAIIEEKDATPEQKLIQEIFPGILLAQAEALGRWLPALKSNNAQGEYYLTDIIRMAALENLEITSSPVTNLAEIQGVNDRVQLIELERYYQESLAKHWLLQGVNMMDYKRVDIRGDFECGQDTIIDVNVVFEGNNIIGKNCYIGPNCVIKNSHLANNVMIKANSMLDGVIAGEACEIGPFSRLRPETVLAEQVKIGNFVEIKKTQIAAHSKASHLTYLGDAIIGENVNIGAGTITCNYDGVNKHQTIIEDGAFIGSDSQLIAPVRVGKNATIGAGSTIRRDAPADQLTLGDMRQKTIPGWKRPVKKEKH